MGKNKIIIKGAREHNLKNIDLEIPRDALVVITGISGSGKSSLAFDTIYAEGQRRYVESLSAYARQFLEQMSKPDLDSVEGLSPAISIEQRTTSKNPRSTVGTITELYDYLRLLFARVGKPHCPECGKEISSQTVQQMVDRVLELPPGTRIHIFSPLVRGRKGEYRKELDELSREGFVRVKIDGKLRELSEPIHLDKNKKHTIEVLIDRLIIKPGLRQRLSDSLEVALKLSLGIVRVEVVGGGELLFSERFACIDCGLSLAEITPRMFSFNNPYGACSTCGGMGTMMYFDPELIVPNPGLSLREGAILPWERKSSLYFYQMLEALAGHYRFDLNTPFKDLPEKIQDILLYGSGKEQIRFFFKRQDRRHSYRQAFEGVIPNLDRRYHDTGSEHIREEIERYMNIRPCPECKGARLRRDSLSVKVKGMSIAEITRLSIKQSSELFYRIRFNRKDREIARRILKEIGERLKFLVDVGLDYLSLDRSAASLSAGEEQRIRLATQVGSSLTGVLYILDEPSIGLHQRDNTRLLKTLKHLRDLRNTVLVVEHDEGTILSADYIIDMGPGAGVHGGEVVAQGTPQEIINNPDSLTGRYLSRSLSIPVPRIRRSLNKRFITIIGARENNLKNIKVRIPLGLFTCVTGVSGSGKSTLIIDTLYQALAQRLYSSKERPGEVKEIKGLEGIDKVIDIDQSPIGRTPRSNPATYTGLFTHVRELFTFLPEAKMRGYLPGRFSFNVKGGRCEACQGDGMIKIEMHFLPDIYVQCEACQGKRYNRETLEVRYKGKNIHEILELTVSQALEFLGNIPHIKAKLQTLNDVGLGYIQLGQPAPTLSGGEAQRIKLSRELSKRSTGRTLYILDEPTTGLHFADIQKLLDVLNRLVDQGNTVVVIEHNLDVIKSADYIIDLGPEGGDEGGRVIATGTPEELTRIKHSYTGQFLKRVLNTDKPAITP